MPPLIDFTQHLIAPLGDVISIELEGVEFGEKGCESNSSIEVNFNFPNDFSFFSRQTSLMIVHVKITICCYASFFLLFQTFARSMINMPTATEHSGYYVELKRQTRLQKSRKANRNYLRLFS